MEMPEYKGLPYVKRMEIESESDDYFRDTS